MKMIIVLLCFVHPLWSSYHDMSEEEKIIYQAMRLLLNEDNLPSYLSTKHTKIPTSKKEKNIKNNTKK